MKPIIVLASCVLLFSCTSTPHALQTSAPGTFMRHGEIVLDLKTDKPSYREGDPVVITLSTSRRASVRIFNEDAEGLRTQLWPNVHSSSSGIVEAGKPLVIPAKGSAFLLKAATPYGINTLVAVASSAPFRPSLSPDDFFVDKVGTGSFGIKGMAWTPASTTGDSKSLTGEARFLYEVKQ